MTPASRRKRTDVPPPPPADRGPSDAGAGTAFVREISARFAELRKEFLDYLAIKVARLKLSLWQKLLGLVAIILGVVLVVAFLATAVVLCLTGVAGAIGDATSRPWLGSLLAGVIGLAAVATALLIVKGILRRKAVEEGIACPDEKSE